MDNLISIGLGEMQITADPKVALVCYGLGSCIGITFWDPQTKTGAMAHIVLPDSSLARGVDAESKFADTCIPYVLGKLARKGISSSRLIIKIAGGAQVLQVSGMKNRLEIGQRNQEAVIEALRREGLQPVGSDVGGNFGRTVQFYVGTGRTVIKTVGKGEKEL